MVGSDCEVIWALGSKFSGSGKWPVLEGAEAGRWEHALASAMAALEPFVDNSCFPAGAVMMLCHLAWSPASDVDGHHAAK